jgi:gamma-glutamyltranspeptidase/glutathione hydrolase
MKKIIVFAFTASLVFIACQSTEKATSLHNINPYDFAIQKKVICEHGAVVSAHPLASKVGLEIMKQGGNAFDAAIATQLALAVVYPNAGNIGGGGFMVARESNGRLIALDYRETASHKAHRDMYLDANGNAQGEKSVNGHLAAGIPGTVAGLFAAAKYGRMDFKKLIQPAIELAEFGYRLTAREAEGLNGLQGDLKKYNTVMPVFVRPTGWKEGDTLVQKDLAGTLKRIRDNGAQGFYEGETARLIVEEMKRGSGIIDYDDLKNYTAKFRDPHVFNYKGYTIVGMPMPSSGGILLHQMMKMVEKRNLAEQGFHTTRSVQLMTEVERRAYADRAEYMGDADFYKVPVKKLTDDDYLAQRMRDYVPGKAGSSQDIKPGPIKESEETTHLNVIDKDGNAIAITTTLNNSYGSKTVIGGAGFILNDEMDDFSIKPGVPNLYGAIGGEANAIAAGKRMLSSMTPTLVLNNGKPYLVTGTPGGTTIPTSVFQTIVNVIDFGLNSEDAVDKPKFHHQWMPDRLFIEKNFPEQVIDSLKKIGYAVGDREAIGRTELIKILPDGKFEVIADNRGEDDAEGW